VADDLVEIYRAGSVQQAHLLKNLLADRDIDAVVGNTVLEGGAGVDVVGWNTLARVSVAESDAELARRIAMEFERTVSDNPELADEIDETVATDEEDDWPRCPGCGEPRLTRCPICETTGTEFPVADPRFVAGTVVEDDAEPTSTCGCGSGGCSSHGHGETHSPGEGETDAPAEAEPEEPPRTLVCTTCDEPFEPQYPRRCAWCGHEFDDGYDVPDESEMLEPIPARAIAVIVGLLALGAALVVYFTVIV
jgi:hypothetical protein